MSACDLPARDPTGESGYVGYRCYLIGVDGGIRKRIELAAADDEVAILQSQIELDSSPFPMAEVWCLHRKIRLVTKSAER